jgi:hypothetical protein
MTTSMCWRASGRMVVVVHGAQNPSNLEWQGLLKQIAERGRGGDLRVLVVSHGGGPDVDQRKALVRAVGSTPAPVAIMTNSRLVRSMIAAMSFFNKLLLAVDLHDVSRAFTHLGLSGAEQLLAKKVRAELEKELGVAAS